MRKYLTRLTGLFILAAPILALAPIASASDLGINVIVAGEIQPGVYGQVEIGNAPRPRLVYDQPRTVIVERQYVHAQPIYLHVPPGHAMHWDKHCQAYHACGRPVYFVRSEEYEPEYQARHEREHDYDDDDHHDNGHGHGKGHGKGKH